MSQENVDLTHRATDAVNRRDLGALLALMDDDVEHVPRAVALEGSYHGHDGIRRWWENVFGVWPELTTQLVEVRDLGGDLTAAAVHWRGQGAGSDIPWDETFWQVVRWRRGKCVWWRAFDTRVEALEAAGLPEQAMSQENVTDERLLYAADNNARWCDMVCRSHGIPTAMQDGLWVALGRSPDLYPDAVTLHPGTTAEDVLGAVQAGPGCSVKDSFAALDLTQMGFAELFRAQWIFRERGPLPQSPVLDWTVVETDEGLDEWAQAAGLSGTLRSGLLREPSVRILAGHGPDGLSAGAIANQTAMVVGVSNVFTTTITAEVAWAGIVDALGVIFPSSSLVGYEQGEDLQPALASGFAELGDLRVWLSEQDAQADS